MRGALPTGRGRLRLETALAHWGEPGRLFLLQAVRLARWMASGASRARAELPRRRGTSVLPPMRWSPRRSRLDSEVGASALAEGSIQFPLLRPLFHEGSRSERARGGEQGRTWFLRPHSLDRLPHPPGTSHRLEAPTSSRLTGSLPGQPESHASGEFRKSRRSSGLRPMACPTLRAGGVRGGGGRTGTTSLRFPPALVGAVRGDLLRCRLAT